MAGSLPSATDGNGHFAVYRGRQRRHVASSCASWELTHLVSLPTVADGKYFAISGGRQRTCHVVTCRWHHTADGKDTRKFAVCHGRQRPAVSHLTDWQRKYCRPPSLPSAARKQTAKKLFTVAFFAGAFCRPRLTAKVFVVRRGRRQSSCFL